MIVLPYLGKSSLELRHRLRKYVNKHISNCKLLVIFRSQRRLSTMFRYKDVMPSDLSSYILYRYTCGTCNSSYIGKTDRHCHIRWCEHLKITTMKRRPSKSKTEATAVYEHISSTGHLGSIDDFEVIARESTRNDFFLRVKESLLIKKHKPIMNENKASTPLLLF